MREVTITFEAEDESAETQQLMREIIRELQEMKADVIGIRQREIHDHTGQIRIPTVSLK
ncbi:MAG: hypothetical protein IJ079_03780 [Lachnospiraceae bacterium]|nr:hypothetical protein [Lachnospiraceae bacterium]MBR1567528.1 hypothetical protein [Lachnospiraceae bacterium]MBR1568684.1 hypothetical protein [Lachnospiraceae bacterium]